MTNNGKFFLQQQVICLLIKIKDFDSMKNIFETIISNDSDINGSYDRNGAILFAYIIFF